MPLDRGIIDQQLEALGEGSRWWEQRELRDLPAVLESDEEILAISRGKVARVRWMRRSWLIVVTQRRLLCLRSSARSWRQLEVSAAQLSRVSLRIGPFRGRVVVAAGGQTYRLLVPSSDAYKLQNALASLGTTAKESSSRFGPTRIVHRMIDHVLALPAVALGPDAPGPRPRAVETAPTRTLPSADRSLLEDRLASLEREVHELRQQVEFLEQLLRQRHAATTAGEGFDSI